MEGYYLLYGSMIVILLLASTRAPLVTAGLLLLAGSFFPSISTRHTSSGVKKDGCGVLYRRTSCPICARSFFNKYSLKRHMIQAHKENHVHTRPYSTFGRIIPYYPGEVPSGGVEWTNAETYLSYDLAGSSASSVDALATSAATASNTLSQLVDAPSLVKSIAAGPSPSANARPKCFLATAPTEPAGHGDKVNNLATPEHKSTAISSLSPKDKNSSENVPNVTTVTSDQVFQF